MKRAFLVNAGQHGREGSLAECAIISALLSADEITELRRRVSPLKENRGRLSRHNRQLSTAFI